MDFILNDKECRRIGTYLATSGQVEAPTIQHYTNWSGECSWKLWVGLRGNERLMQRYTVEGNMLRN